MNKILSVILAVIILSMSGCSSKANESSVISLTVTPIPTVSTDLQNISELEDTVIALEAQVADLQSKLTQVTTERDTLQAKLDNVDKETKVEESDVTVLVTDKKNIPADINNGKYSDNVQVVFSITNNTAKNIQGVQGTLEIQDLFGKTIMNSGCDFTGKTIKAGKTIINDDMALEINQFMDNHNKLYTTEYRDLKFSYKVTKIVFEDGTVKE